MFAKSASLLALLVVVLLQEVTGNAVSAGELARRQSSSSTTITTFTQKWSEVSTYFSDCRNTFQSTTSYEVAIKSVDTLYQRCQPVATSYPSCAGCASVAQSSSSQVATFQQSIQRSFTTWQEIIKIGKSRFSDRWQSDFAPSFARFDVVVKAANSACSSLNLKLDVLLKGLRLDLNLFLGININLGGILGIVGSLLGGILGRREVQLLEE